MIPYCEGRNDDTTIQLACEHKFHAECILKWTNQYHKYTCPICRKPAKSNTLKIKRVLFG